LNGIKTTQLRNLTTFPDNGKTLAELLKSKYTIQVEVMRMILEAEAMHLVLDALTAVGNDATAIKEYITALTSEHTRTGYFGDYYFDQGRTVAGLGFLVYELQDGNLVAVR
jgi:hypothetical protein